MFSGKLLFAIEPYQSWDKPNIRSNQEHWNFSPSRHAEGTGGNKRAFGRYEVAVPIERVHPKVRLHLVSSVGCFLPLQQRRPKYGLDLIKELLVSEPLPMGLIAYSDTSPVAWCAAGPRSRYARAIKTPTYKGRDPSEDETMIELLALAVQLADLHGVTAIEGFPLSDSKLRSSGDTQVGIESVFVECGFDAIQRPTEQRVVMRQNLL